MKICNCGYQNQDADKFCRQCGSPLPEATAQTAQQVPPMPEQQMTPTPPNPFPMLSALKEKGGSVAFLIATILFTLSLVLTIVNAFNIQESFYQMVATYSAFGMVDMSEFYEIVNQMTPVIIGIILLFSIPTVVICIGLWCIYGTCKKSGNEPLKTGGFTAIQVISVLQLIGTILGFIFVILSFVIVFAAAASEGLSISQLIREASAMGDLGYGQASDIAGIIAGAIGLVVVIMIVTMVLSIVYQVKIITSLSCAKKIIVTGKTEKNVSAFVGVFMIIGGITNIISGLFSGFDLQTMIAGIASILFATLIFSMRSAINAYR